MKHPSARFLLGLLIVTGFVGLSKTTPTAVHPIFAQEDNSCPALVQQALADVETACADLGRNEACYGNTQVLSQPDGLLFTTPGDLVAVSSLEGLQLSSMDVEASEWGISLLQLQISLPDDTAENVDLVLFGNVEITPVAVIPLTFAVTPDAANNVNIRSIPSSDNSISSIVGTLAAGDSLTTDGRTAAGDWLRVKLADGSDAWIFAELVTVDGESADLAVVDGTPVAPNLGAMQAFYLRSGAADRPCDEAPDSGLLIQTPEGQGEITFLINEVTIDLGSTAYLQAQPAGDMTISVLEGQAVVTAQGVTVTAPAGNVVRIPLDANGLASGAPSSAEPYDAATLLTLPITLLEQDIEIASLATEDEIAAVPAQNENVSATDVTPVAGDWLLVVAENPTYPADCPSITLSFGSIWWPRSEVKALTAEQVTTIASWARGNEPTEVFDNPEPGLYTSDITLEAGTHDPHVHSELRILSPTEVEGTRVIDYYGCIVTSFFTMTAQFIEWVNDFQEPTIPATCVEATASQPLSISRNGIYTNTADELASFS